MSRRAPIRRLSEEEQRAALARGDQTVAKLLSDIDGLVRNMREEVSAIHGRANRMAGQLGSLNGQSEVRVQASEADSRQEAAVDWLASAPTILRIALRDLRKTLAELQ